MKTISLFRYVIRLSRYLVLAATECTVQSLMLEHPFFLFQHYLYEMIINILVRNNCFYQLHQFLQYHVLQDSKPLVRFSRIHIEVKLKYCKRQLPLLKAEIVSKQCKTLYHSILGTSTPFFFLKTHITNPFHIVRHCVTNNIYHYLYFNLVFLLHRPV